MPNHTMPLDDEGLYHIYNRAVGNERLFTDEKHYKRFLSKIERHLLPYLDIWSYCLMPNHFHLLAEIKTESNGAMVSKALSDCCNGYTKWLNVLGDRKGNLFARPFKRRKIKDDAHLAWIIWYIHRNPIHHHYVKTLDEWKFSSYKAILSPKTKLAAEKVLNFFGSKDAYIAFHDIQQDECFDTLE